MQLVDYLTLYERMLYYIMETYDLRRSDAEKCMKAAFDTAKELSIEANIRSLRD